MCLLFLLAPLLSGLVAVLAAVCSLAALATVAIVEGVVGLFCLLLAPFGFKREPRRRRALPVTASRLTGHGTGSPWSRIDGSHVLRLYPPAPRGPRPPSVMRAPARSQP